MDGPWVDGWVGHGWVDGPWMWWVDGPWMDGWAMDGWMGHGWVNSFGEGSLLFDEALRRVGADIYIYIIYMHTI